jgi:FlaA1/EpsC-like NDP-sugar epimerase
VATATIAHNRSRRVARFAASVRGDSPLVALDLVMALFAYLLLLALRFEADVPATYWERLRVFLPVACATHIITNLLWKVYGRTWRHASVDEARRLLLAGSTTMVVLLLLFTWGEQRMPLTVLVGGPIVATLLFGLVRFQSRLFAFRKSRVSGRAVRVAVVGSGREAASALREMRQDESLGFVPVAVVEENPAYDGRSLNGVPRVGSVDELSRIVDEYDVDQILLALPDGARTTIRKVADAADIAGVPVRTLRPSGSWARGMPQLRDIRDLRIEDLLRREPVTIDLEPVRRLLEGRRVLVTGGGGWIGAEIARQVATFDPEHLAILDHDETHLHDVAETMTGPADMVLADIRDADVIDGVFARVRPDVVFHAAAHKHVPILESFACEAVRTNVFGSLNVITSSRRHNVEHVVFISTDKAATPTSVMGASKWLAEQILLERGDQPGYCAVRFGNVLGSRGSVIPTFQRQISAGGPVTVTSREMTRFFMSTDEAVRLVLVAGAVAEDRKVMALEMGEQANMYELAERMIRLCGQSPHEDIEIRITGLRPGENLAEALIGPAEVGTHDRANPVIGITPTRLSPGELDETLEVLRRAIDTDDGTVARETLLTISSRAANVVAFPSASRTG